MNGKMNGISYGNINGNIYLWQNPIEFPISKDQWDYFNRKQSGTSPKKSMNH